MSDKRSSKWYRQRKKMGFDDRDTWSLDARIAELVLPRLIRFKEVKKGYPGCLESEKEWDHILDKMIFAMREIVDDEPQIHTEKDYLKYIKRIQEGCVLFGKYFRNLWW